jgi:hypothetical protein
VVTTVFAPDGRSLNLGIPFTNGSVPTTKLWEDDDDPDTP